MLTLRTLSLSLLLTIVVTSIGAGLLLDKLYSTLNSSDQPDSGLTQPQLEAIGIQLSATLRNIESKEEFIRIWQKGNPFISLEIVQQDDMKIPAELIQELKKTGYLTLSSSSIISAYFPNNADSFFVLRTPQITKPKKNNWLPILFTILFYALLIAITVMWLTPLIRRLQTIKSSAKKLGEGNLSARIAPGNISYINDIELEFNRMAQRIEDLVSDISLLSSAISHELRAPLAKLQFGLDALRDEDDIEKRHTYEDRLDKVIADMTNLVETLLKYARLDKNIAQLTQGKMDLLELCNNAITSITQQDDKKAFTEINITAAENFYIVNGDAFYLNLLIENLLSNAVKYGSGKILVSVQQYEKHILLSIEDNGQGIDKQFRQDIFKPFIRGKNTESNPHQPAQKGHGLGMALVKRIADLHNVTIDIATSETLGGARFTLSFPRIHSSHA
ncbi:ATP-binding protein [Cellvibrio sp. pealriver]|uniref:HAMP domain-containing sensor histidine kinase n=1 Tax=Cellvibrio sp. pealriver TaxID=1622269 RepID=UPI00066FFD2A|nr:ATP-binding protein [Cellvibrio sp. pealriver]